MVVGIVYKATNIINSKVYIGQTGKTLKERKRNHRNEANKEKPKYLFHRAIKKYGIEAFTWEVIDNGYSLNDLDIKEKWWISFYDSLYIFGKGYNLASGGGRNSNPYAGKTAKEIQLSVQKRREAIEAKGGLSGKNNPFYGKHHTKKTKELISKQKMGVKLSIEHRKNISDGLQGRKQSSATKEKIKESLLGRFKGEQSPSYGLKRSESECKAISERSKGEKNNSAKSVFCIELNKKFAYMGLAAEEIYGSKSKYSYIYRSIKNNKKVQGYSWKYS